jgi:hypothetical protein
VGLLLLPLGAKANPHLHLEKAYQEVFARQVQGQVEVVMPDGARCDVLTASHAIEVDFASKWSEAIGQSLFYGIQTNRQPGILLILEKPEDRRFLVRLGTVIREHHLPIKLWTINPEWKIEETKLE